MGKRGIRAVIGLILLTSVGVACGDDDDDDTATSEAASTPTEAATAETDAATPATDAATPATEAASDGTEAAAAGSEFVIEDFAFPEGFVATAGEEFTIRNADSGSRHTVTSDEFDVEVAGGASEPLTINAAGTYDIHCEIHPAMTGTITVE